MDDSIRKALVEIVGEDNVTDRLIDMVSYAYDSSEHSHRPDCAVWATTTGQVSQILKLANEQRIPVIPRGAGTGLSGMAVPVKGGIVLDLNRMNKIERISIEDRFAVVQPGVVYADLDKALAPYGFCFPPDPGSGTVCTLGGNVSTNAGGVRGAKYGTTRDYVLGLEVVLADGRVMRTGSSTIKCVSGFDLTRLIVGSEGTLGVVTRITLKINPKPTASSTAVATFEKLEDAGKAVTEIMSSGIIPAVMEIMDRPTIQAINQNTELGLPEVDAMLLVETDGYTQAETDYQLEKVVAVFNANHPLEVKKASSREEALDLWKARKSAYAVLARIQSHFVLEDVTVPMGKIADLLRGIGDISRRHDLQIATFGHAGDGNLHPQILYDGYNPDEVARVEKAVADLFELSIKLNGTLTGEHGIGLAKAPFMTLEHDAVAIDAMRLVKRAFDPNNILNPGKMALEVN
ncbi:MAG: FAD-linked oxidase C-terminal domain-containing protein [Desulfobacteraceae bacterium]